MRCFLTTLLFLLLVVSAAASPSDVENHIRFFKALDSRADGTEGEREAFEYIAGHLDDLNIFYDRQSLNNGERGHSFSENIIAEIPGTNPGRYILAAPVDSGAFSTAFLLEMAGKLTINPPGNTIILAFLGAEDGDTRFHPYGSRRASEQLNQEEKIFAVYLDSDEVPESWNIRIGGDGRIAPFWLTKTVAEVFPYRLRGTDIQVARLGLQGDIGPLSAWLETEIPTILFEGSGVAADDERYRQIGRLIKALSTIDYMLDEIPENRESTYIFLRHIRTSLYFCVSHSVGTSDVHNPPPVTGRQTESAAFRPLLVDLAAVVHHRVSVPFSFNPDC